jgi:Tol biopolymer transport system component
MQRFNRMRDVPHRPRLRAGILGGGAVVLLLVIAGSALLARAGATGVSVPRLQQVFLIDATGRNLKQLTSGSVSHSSVTWLPGGRRVAELASRGALSWIESQTTHGTGAQKLSSTVSTPQTTPAMVYSPAAHMTAAGVFNENQLSDTLEILGAPVTRPTVIDTFPDTGGGPDPSVWSPDGQTLAYTRPKGPLHTPTVGAFTDGPDRIVLVNLRTRERRTIAAGGRGAAGPVFSPNGKWIVYTEGSKAYSPLEIALAQGGPARQITSNVGSGTPAWSPDGRSVAFTGYAKGNSAPYLFVVNVKTGRLRRLAGSVQDLTPAWSPDSRYIAFATWFTALVPTPAQGYGAVEIITPNGTGERVIAGIPNSQTDDLAWSPNGSQIAFTLGPAPTGD